MAALEYMRQKTGVTPASLAIRIRRSTKKAFPHLQLADLDSIMIAHFLRAMDNKELTRLALTQDLRLFQKVIEIATRLSLADGASTNKLSKPAILNFQEKRQEIDTDEATLARINKLVISRVDDALSEQSRGRPRDRQSRDRGDKASSTVRRDGSANRRDHSTGKGRAYTPRAPSSD